MGGDFAIEDDGFNVRAVTVDLEGFVITFRVVSPRIGAREAEGFGASGVVVVGRVGAGAFGGRHDAEANKKL